MEHYFALLYAKVGCLGGMIGREWWVGVGIPVVDTKIHSQMRCVWDHLVGRSQSYSTYDVYGLLLGQTLCCWMSDTAAKTLLLDCHLIFRRTWILPSPLLSQRR